jgi:hypothetical protein
MNIFHVVYKLAAPQESLVIHDMYVSVLYVNKVHLSIPYHLPNLTYLVVTLIQIIKSPPQGRVWDIGT